MPINPDLVVEVIQKKGAEHGKLLKKAIADADGDKEKIKPPKRLFISQNELFKELNVITDTDKEGVIQSASTFIDSINFEAKESNTPDLIIETDISHEEMERAKHFRESDYDINKFNRNQIKRKVTSGCFIATATYGSSLSEEVIVLKEWRDNYLLKSYTGRFLVNFYYRISPPIAKVIEKSLLLKILVKGFLLPLLKVINKIKI